MTKIIYTAITILFFWMCIDGVHWERSFVVVGLSILCLLALGEWWFKYDPQINESHYRLGFRHGCLLCIIIAFFVFALTHF